LGTQGIPQVKWYGKDENNYYMVINLLGKSLDNLINEKQKFSLKLTLQIGIQLLYLLKAIHDKGLVHRDVKPDNFLLGVNENSCKLFLIDFGLCKTYLQDDRHIEMKETSGLIGSPSFASINAHKNIELSRRDDL
jgi:serine/threonine protein kinase